MDRKEHYRNSQEIDLIQLFLTILCRWRVLVIAVIIGAILGGGYAYIKGNTGSSGSDKPVSIKPDKLSDMKAAKDYYDNYMLEQKWFENSPVAKIGYSDGYTAVSKYSIKGDEAILYASVYTSLAKSQELGDYIYDNVDFDFSREYFGEIIDASINNYDQLNNTNVNHLEITMLNPTDFANADSEVDKNHRAESKNPSSKGSALVTYTLKLDDKDKVLKAMELLDTYLSDYYSKNSEDNEYTLEKLDIIYGMTPSIFGAEKEEHIVKRNTISASYWKLVKAFSDDEKQYFYDGFLNKDNVDLDASVAAKKQSGRGSYIKYVVIGVLLAGFMAAGVICCIYVFGGRIKNASELGALGVSVYGVKRGSGGDSGSGKVNGSGVDSGSGASKESGKKRGTALDRWLQGMLESYSGLTLTNDYVTKSIQLQGIESVYVYNNSSLAEGEGVCDIKLWDSIPNVHISSLASHNDRDALIKAKELGSELIVVELNKSKVKDLIEELETADLQKIKVVGVVCV